MTEAFGIFTDDYLEFNPGDHDTLVKEASKHWKEMKEEEKRDYYERERLRKHVMTQIQEKSPADLVIEKLMRNHKLIREDKGEGEEKKEKRNKKRNKKRQREEKEEKGAGAEEKEERKIEEKGGEKIEEKGGEKIEEKGGEKIEEKGGEKKQKKIYKCGLCKEAGHTRRRCVLYVKPPSEPSPPVQDPSPSPPVQDPSPPPVQDPSPPVQNPSPPPPPVQDPSPSTTSVTPTFCLPFTAETITPRDIVHHIMDYNRFKVETTEKVGDMNEMFKKLLQRQNEISRKVNHFSL